MGWPDIDTGSFGFILRDTLINEWQNILATAGFTLTLASDPGTPASAPSGEPPTRSYTCTHGTLRASIWAGYSPTNCLYLLDILMEPLSENFELGRKIYDVLVEHGALPADNCIDILADKVAGRPIRKLVVPPEVDRLFRQTRRRLRGRGL